ncbi:hypothetical protein [Frateuria sp. YIM B11624]|uniref:hypothetical protein n=1 Tax=Frateuria sp. YIM B11624 TaxID=3143185 RepID=UPI003C733D88
MEFKDKIAIAGALAAAALATAKLIADKESKISDVRRDWINGLRNALCDCLASAHVIAGRIQIRRKHKSGSLSEADITELESELTEHWATFRHAFQMALLHLNFSESALALLPGYQRSNSPPKSDTEVWEMLTKSRTASPYYNHLHSLTSPVGFPRVDPPASAAAAELGKTLVDLRATLLGEYDGVGSGHAYQQIEDNIHKATMLANLVIEPEWALIKRGEMAHRSAILVSVCLVLYGAIRLFGV